MSPSSDRTGPQESVALTVHDMQPYTPSAEEAAELADLVAKHRQRGPWRLTLPSADLGAQLRAGTIGKVEMAHALARLMRESAWGAEADPGSDVALLMLEMADCDDEAHADELLGLMYDAADADRVWIEP